MSGGGTYTPELEDFRWYDDDSSDLDLQTALDTQGTNITLATTGRAVLRVRIAEIGGKNGPNTSHKFQYRKNAGTWTDLTITSADCRLFDGLVGNATAIDGTTNIERLTGGGGAYDSTGGYYMDGVTGTPSGNLSADDRWEQAVCVQLVNADVAHNDTIQFRVRDDAGSTFTDTAVPQITVNKNIYYPDQTGFRFYEDDGTAIAALNVVPTRNDLLPDVNYRCRILFKEQNGFASPASTGIKVQFKQLSGGTWTDLTTTSSPVKSVNSTNVTDGAATSQLIGTGTFDGGFYDEQGDGGGLFTHSANSEREHEFTFQMVSGATLISDINAQDRQITFRFVDDGGTPFGQYTQDASLYATDGMDRSLFRWRNDDGTETTATWIAAEGVDISSPTLDQNYRLRFAVGSTTSAYDSSATQNLRLQYSKNDGAWTNVSGSSTNVRSSLSSNFIDNDNCSQQLSSGDSRLHRAGQMDEVDGVASSDLVIADTGRIREYEWCFQFRSADMSASDKIEFRAVDDSLQSVELSGLTLPNKIAGVNTGTATNLDQSDFRAENNDGSESGSTFRAAENTNWTDSPDRHIRLRFAIEENGGVNGSITAPTLYYNKNSGGWNAVTTSSSNVQALGTTGSRHLTDHGASTQRITAAGTFTAGTVDDNDGALPTKSINANNYTNFVFSFYIIPGDVADGDTIQLRVQDGVTALDAYTQTPTITVAKAPSFALKNFRFRNDDGSETTATWREDASMPAVFAPGDEFRLRGLVSAGAADQTIQGFIWQYSKNKGTWTNLTNSTSANIYVFDSTNLTAYTGTTTQQLGSGTFRTGITVDTDVLTDKDIAFLGSDESEFEVALKLHATNNSAGDFYDFRAIPIDPGDASNSVIVSTDSMPLLVVTTAGTELVKAFQEGVVPAAYTGAQDATIIENTPGTGDNSSLLGFDGDDPVSSGFEKRALVEWDISDVPSNATVVDALITGYIANTWTPAYDTVENTSSWTDSTVNWTGRPSQTATNLCPIGPTVGGLRPISNDFNTTGIAVIQDWVDGTDTTNDGFSIQEGATATDGGNIASDSESVTGRRPRLTIIYTAASGVGPLAFNNLSRGNQ